MEKSSTGLEIYVTNPAHGGKVGCHKCHLFIEEGKEHKVEIRERGAEYDVWFHEACWNPYEHYYGLDKPID